MSDSAKGAPPPTITTTPPKPQGQGKGQRTPSAAQGKRNNRGNNNNNARKQVPHIDGAVSDSVASNYPQARRPSRQGQSVAQGAYLQYSSNQSGETNGQRMRPVSMGGPMLPGTPAKERAYAQSTFQASPAASALPVPKFFGSKSVPNVNVPSSLQARMDGEKTPEEPQESSPEPEIVSPIKQSHGKSQTPLDMFFMADKAEKERKSSPSINLSPDLAVRPPPASEHRNPFQTNRQSPFTRGISEAEGPMLSPRTVPQGPRPVHLSRAHSSPGGGANSPKQQSASNEASTQALKDLLFNNISNKPSSTPPRTHQRAPSDTNSVDECHQTPSPAQYHSALGPSTPTPVKQSQDQYALHYGNRNLSPMFQAARNETPPRPSNLRQQVNQSGHQNGFPQYNQQPFPNHHADPNSFSRSYLDQQIRGSLSAQPPPGLISNCNNTNSAASFSGPPPTSQNSMQMPNGTSGSPRNSGTRDMKGMEDDLRRMLNLNVLG
jgi:hypothetical protein